MIVGKLLKRFFVAKTFYLLLVERLLGRRSRVLAGVGWPKDLVTEVADPWGEFSILQLPQII